MLCLKLIKSTENIVEYLYNHWILIQITPRITMGHRMVILTKLM